MIKAPATKSELVELVSSARAAWESLLVDLQPRDYEQPSVAGEWSLKDMIAHLAWFENEMVGMLEARALVGSELWNLSQDKRNQAIYLQNKDRSLNDLLSASRHIYARLLGLLEGLKDAELHDPARFNDMPTDWVPWRIIAGNTYLHYLDHAQDIQVWLEGNL